MGIIRSFAKVMLILLGCYAMVQLCRTPPVPDLDPDPYWGPGERKPEDTKVRPFVIDIPEKDVDDLKARLSLPPRFALPLDEVKFFYGMDSTTMAVILKYWKDTYDWKKREKKLNTFKHFKTRIEGLDIHFMRASPPANSGKTVRPLLLLHGWPGSFVEFMDILPLLTTPRPDSEVVFDVVCPSLPGYGFSEAAAKPGLHTLAMAQIMTKLMKRLGFSKYYVQGGDWGSAISLDIGTVFPDDLYGLHVNVLNLMTPGLLAKLLLGTVLPSGTIMEPELEQKWYPLSKFLGILAGESGYMHLQATKPDTVGIALNSSPLGLAAYILEKFGSWTNLENVARKDGGLLDSDFPFSLDAILDNICVYWYSSTVCNVFILFSDKQLLIELFCFSLFYSIPTSVPAGLVNFKNELVRMPENLAAHKLHNLVSYTLLDSGGHFAAMEVPKLLNDDIFKFVNVVEDRLKTITKKTKKSDL
ncbi:Epoxide hydrolase N-terminal [Trinorchestia longiramus]|nr:Epoxide hydrolase N-terminal [Trinorchestia longiramus]